MGLLEEDLHGSSYATMLQGLTRFLLDRMVQDFRSFPPKDVTTTLEEVGDTRIGVEAFHFRTNL